ncbi:unnamed protein product [Prorocentrum cordatum]|uniref:Uncharacterized protein n=1 Tax=Prorocentrum cordatum TaxID=2364126 RepID=A0ABN9YE03_9DINO|nr:unnamed protein product [Polarella glacialis]
MGGGRRREGRGGRTSSISVELQKTVSGSERYAMRWPFDLWIATLGRLSWLPPSPSPWKKRQTKIRRRRRDNGKDVSDFAGTGRRWSGSLRASALAAVLGPQASTQEENQMRGGCPAQIPMRWSNHGGRLGAEDDGPTASRRAQLVPKRSPPGVAWPSGPERHLSPLSGEMAVSLRASAGWSPLSTRTRASASGPGPPAGPPAGSDRNWTSSSSGRLAGASSPSARGRPPAAPPPPAATGRRPPRVLPQHLTVRSRRRRMLWRHLRAEAELGLEPAVERVEPARRSRPRVALGERAVQRRRLPVLGALGPRHAEALAWMEE